MQNLKTAIEKPVTVEAPQGLHEEDVLSADAFRRELEREILRSDRSGVPLTLLAFDIRATFRSAEERASCLSVLAKAVVQCSRRTDSRGWYADEGHLRVGLLLHNTVAERAVRIIDAVRACVADTLEAAVADGWPREVSCQVFIYPPDQAVLDEYGEAAGERFSDPPRAGEVHMVRVRRLSELIGRPLPMWKRVVDILGAGTGLLILSPLFAALAVGIKLTSPGPVFFKQERIGHLGKPFLFWKFRTMRHRYDPVEHKKHLETLIQTGDSEKPMQKLDKGNSAITPLGRLLRMSSLDELPQLINVLRGEMSLIGPRPCLRYEAEKYKCWHSRRFDVVPGMTGLWQVSGKNRTTFKEMIRFDIEYARNCSFILDLKILLRTFPTIWEDVRQGVAPRQVAEVRNVR